VRDRVRYTTTRPTASERILFITNIPNCSERAHYRYLNTGLVVTMILWVPDFWVMARVHVKDDGDLDGNLHNQLSGGGVEKGDSEVKELRSTRLSQSLSRT